MIIVVSDIGINEISRQILKDKY